MTYVLTVIAIVSVVGWLAVLSIAIFLAYACFINPATLIVLTTAPFITLFWTHLALTCRRAEARNRALTGSIVSLFLAGFAWISIPMHTRVFKHVYLMQKKGMSFDEADPIAHALLIENLPRIPLSLVAISFVATVIIMVCRTIGPTGPLNSGPSS